MKKAIQPHEKEKGGERDISTLNPKTVTRFLEDLAEKDARVRERVEALFLSSDAALLSESLKARLAGFHALPDILGFRDLFPLARDFRSFLSDTNLLMAPLDTGVALDLVDHFLDLDRILEGLEEGGGPLQPVFFEACDLWLALAAKSGLAMDWGEKILAHFLKDRFGVRANLMRHGDRLLSMEALGRLADRMLADAEEKALDTRAEWHRYRLSMGLRYLSQALRNPDLMARSITLVQTEPSPRQIGDIVEAYLTYRGPEAALAWLTGDWGDRELERLDLLDQVYGAMDDREMLFQIRRERYGAQPSAEYLLSLLEVCDPEERAAFLATAPETARHTRCLYSGLNLLLSVGATLDAEALLVERKDDLADYDHTAISRIQEKFMATDSTLGQILCYRTLVEGILKEARFRAYGKAVDYCEIMESLDQKIRNYGNLPSHGTYLSSLRMRYGDKRVFWQRLEGDGEWEEGEMPREGGHRPEEDGDFWEDHGDGDWEKESPKVLSPGERSPWPEDRREGGRVENNVPRETSEGTGEGSVPLGTRRESLPGKGHAALHEGGNSPRHSRKPSEKRPPRRKPKGTRGGIPG